MSWLVVITSVQFTRRSKVSTNAISVIHVSACVCELGEQVNTVYSIIKEALFIYIYTLIERRQQKAREVNGSRDMTRRITKHRDSLPISIV